MTLHRAFLAFLLISSLVVGPTWALDSSPKKDEKPAAKEEKKDAKSKEASKPSRKEKDKDKPSAKKSSHKEAKPAKPSKKQAKEGMSPSDKPAEKKDVDKKRTEKKGDQKKESAEKKSAAKDDTQEAAPKKEMKSEPKKEAPKKNEPTPAKKPQPKEDKKEVESADKPEPKIPPQMDPKEEAKPEPKEESKPAPKPEPKPQPKPQPKPDPKKLAYTDPSEVDEDFAFQGEYYGKLILPGGIVEKTGIQVIARGGGNFVARQLRGGLPGNGWRNDAKIDLNGKRDGNILVLSQGGYEVTIVNDKAVVTNAAGKTLGVLNKVQRRSELLGLKPTSGATVLFDGKPETGFLNAKINDKGELQIGTITKDPVQDFRMHLEFRLPYMPYATGQARSNSGLYIQESYEVQILDSFGLPGEFNECGSLYRTKSPDVNMCFPPLSWQTYDVYFTAARFDDAGKKIAPARITVQHNGILVQDNFLIPNKTGAGKQETPEPRPIKLQDHGNPVVFRNIWIEYLGGDTVTSEDVSASENLPTPAKR